MITYGLIADTHIPDRCRALNPAIETIFREAGVQHILHAGDVSTPPVLETLQQIAPVTAVKGNRDIWKLGRLPYTASLTAGDTRIGLAHGHGGILGYFKEKFSFRLLGYRLTYYFPYLLQTFPGADVIVFGHSHVPEIVNHQGKTIINPGSACSPYRNEPPSVALLHVMGRTVSATIEYLA